MKSYNILNNRLNKLFLVFLCTFSAINSAQALTCIGRDYVQKTSDINELPNLIIEGIPSGIQVGDTISLEAKISVDVASGGIPNLYWCVTSGNLYQAGTTDLTKVNFNLLSASSGSTVTLWVKLSDGLGYMHARRFDIPIVTNKESVFFSSDNEGINIRTAKEFFAYPIKVLFDNQVIYEGDDIDISIPVNSIPDKFFSVQILNSNSEIIFSGNYPFRDIRNNLWFSQAVITLWKNSIIQGYKNGSSGIYGPYNNALRAEILAVIGRILHWELTDTNSDTFLDVDSQDWFYPFVSYAKSHDIVSGCDSDGNIFCPARYVTRAEAAKILALAFPQVENAIMTCSTQSNSAFSDVSSSDWFASYICAVKAMGIMNGFHDNTFRPNQPLTRAEMAQAVCIAAYGTSECIADGDELLPVVAAVSPSIATVGEALTLSVEGFHLPEPVAMLLSGCDNLTPTGTPTPEKQDFTCTPNSEGVLTGQMTDDTGMVLFEFTLDVQADSSTEPTEPEPPVDPVDPTDPTDPVVPPVEPTEPGGAAENPGDAAQMFIVNGTIVTTCTFADVDQTSVFAEAVNALCSAGILVGYWEEDVLRSGQYRVFVKLEADASDAVRTTGDNKFLFANLAEVLKVYLYSAFYKTIAGKHDENSATWYEPYMEAATAIGIDYGNMTESDRVTRGQAMTWLAQIFYNYTGSDPIALLQSKGITDGSKLDNDLTRYELALLAYRAILDTGRENDILFGLWGQPAPKPSPLGSDIAVKAESAIGTKYPYVDGGFTYSARFVRMMFDKPATWAYAKDMCDHYAGNLIADENPPAGAVLCYAPDAGNDNLGHVAIAVGGGSEVGASSLTDGVVQRASVYGSAYIGWVSAETFSNQYPQ